MNIDRRARIAALLLATAAQLGCGAGADGPSAHSPAPAAGPAPVMRQTVSDNGDESIVDFYKPLAPYGDWLEGTRYGDVWVPSAEVVGEDFVPYTSGGGWISTDAGWVFQTPWDEAWGWAVFHYGRWYEDETYGWVWAPEVVWGPSWVDWRYGGAYVGWAPTTPEGAPAAQGAYTFVETSHLVDPHVGASRVAAEGAGAAYGQTQPVREHGSHRGVPGAYLIAAGVVVQPTHLDVPGPGDLRRQAQRAATRAVPGNGKKTHGAHPRHARSPKR